MTDPGMDLDGMDLDGRLEEYLRIRRSLGYKLERDGKLLAQFIAWLHEQHAAAVTVEHAVAWVSLPAAGSGWLRLRMSVVPVLPPTCTPSIRRCRCHPRVCSRPARIARCRICTPLTSWPRCSRPPTRCATRCNEPLIER